MLFIPVHFHMPYLTVKEGVFAVGRIVPDTPSRFDAFRSRNPSLMTRGDVVHLLSGGGDVTAGLALGREIRKLGLQTMVGIPA
jgi:hypothetical protein